MQKISTKKMSHKAAKDYRDQVQDAVMYQHTSGAVYVIASPDDGDDAPRRHSDDVNDLLIG